MHIKKILLFVLLLLLIIFTSTTGYMVVEKWNFSDSLFMSVITIATVGYGEVVPLTEAGRWLSIIIIMSGVGFFGYVGSQIMAEISTMDHSKRRKKKMEKKISALKGHTIICGFGRMGVVACKELKKHDLPFVVIEQRDGLVEILKDTGYFYIAGPAGDDEILLKAGIKKASTLISLIDDDTEGLYMAIVGRSLNIKLNIIVRANDFRAKARIIRAGANKVIRPYAMTGRRVAESVINPAVDDFFDFTDDDETSDKIQLADLYVTPKSPIINNSIKMIGNKISNLIIIGIRSDINNNEFLFKPSSNYIFQPGDYIVTMGTKTAYDKAKKDFKLLSKSQF